MPEENQVVKNESTTTEPVKKKGLSTGAKVGIGIGIGCCVIILIILGLILGGVWKIGNKIEEENKYAKEFTEISDDINKNLNEFHISMDIALKKLPNFDSTDIAAADKAYANLNKDYDRLLKIDVPDKYKNIHQLFEKGIKYYTGGIMLYKNGLNTKKQQDFQSSSDLFQKGEKELEKAQKELEKIKSD